MLAKHEFGLRIIMALVHLCIILPLRRIRQHELFERDALGDFSFHGGGQRKTVHHTVHAVHPRIGIPDETERKVIDIGSKDLATQDRPQNRRIDLVAILVVLAAQRLPQKLFGGGPSRFENVHVSEFVFVGDDAAGGPRFASGTGHGLFLQTGVPLYEFASVAPVHWGGGFYEGSVLVGAGIQFAFGAGSTLEMLPLSIVRIIFLH